MPLDSCPIPEANNDFAGRRLIKQLDIVNGVKLPPEVCPQAIVNPVRKTTIAGVSDPGREGSPVLGEVRPSCCCSIHDRAYNLVPESMQDVFGGRV